MIEPNTVGLIDFIPPPPKKYTVADNFKSWALNVLTLGFYDSSKLVMKERQVAVYEQHKTALQLKLTNTENCFEPLRKQIEKVTSSLSHQTPEADIEKLKDDLKAHTFKPLEFIPTFAPLALEAIAYIGHVIANIVTIGFYGVMKERAVL